MAKRALKPTEHQEQAAVVQWFQSYARTKGIDPRLLIAIPNSQILLGLCKSDKDRLRVLAYLKAEGMQPGVPDLMLALPKWFKRGTSTSVATNSAIWNDPESLFASLFLEMKRKGGKPSQAQLDMADLLRRASYNVVIAYGFEEAQRAIKGYIET